MLPRQEAVFNPKNLNQLSKSLLEHFGRSKRGRRRVKWEKSAEASFTRVDIVDEKACGMSQKSVPVVADANDEFVQMI